MSKIRHYYMIKYIYTDESLSGVPHWLFQAFAPGWSDHSSRKYHAYYPDDGTRNKRNFRAKARRRLK